MLREVTRGICNLAVSFANDVFQNMIIQYTLFIKVIISLLEIWDIMNLLFIISWG